MTWTYKVECDKCHKRGAVAIDISSPSRKATLLSKILRWHASPCNGKISCERVIDDVAKLIRA